MGDNSDPEQIPRDASEEENQGVPADPPVGRGVRFGETEYAEPEPEREEEKAFGVEDEEEKSRESQKSKESSVSPKVRIRGAYMVHSISEEEMKEFLHTTDKVHSPEIWVNPNNTPPPPLTEEPNVEPMEVEMKDVEVKQTQEKRGVKRKPPLLRRHTLNNIPMNRIISPTFSRAAITEIVSSFEDVAEIENSPPAEMIWQNLITAPDRNRYSNEIIAELQTIWKTVYSLEDTIEEEFNPQPINLAKLSDKDINKLRRNYILKRDYLTVKPHEVKAFRIFSKALGRESRYMQYGSEFLENLENVSVDMVHKLGEKLDEFKKFRDSAFCNDIEFFWLLTIFIHAINHHNEWIVAWGIYETMNCMERIHEVARKNLCGLDYLLNFERYKGLVLTVLIPNLTKPFFYICLVKWNKFEALCMKGKEFFCTIPISRENTQKLTAKFNEVKCVNTKFMLSHWITMIKCEKRWSFEEGKDLMTKIINSVKEIRFKSLRTVILRNLFYFFFRIINLKYEFLEWIADTLADISPKTPTHFLDFLFKTFKDIISTREYFAIPRMDGTLFVKLRDCMKMKNPSCIEHAKMFWLAISTNKEYFKECGETIIEEIRKCSANPNTVRSEMLLMYSEFLVYVHDRTLIDYGPGWLPCIRELTPAILSIFSKHNNHNLDEIYAARQIHIPFVQRIRLEDVGLSKDEDFFNVYAVEERKRLGAIRLFFLDEFISRWKIHEDDVRFQSVRAYFATTMTLEQRLDKPSMEFLGNRNFLARNDQTENSDELEDILHSVQLRLFRKLSGFNDDRRGNGDRSERIVNEAKKQLSKCGDRAKLELLGIISDHIGQYPVLSREAIIKEIQEHLDREKLDGKTENVMELWEEFAKITLTAAREVVRNKVAGPILQILRDLFIGTHAIARRDCRVAAGVLNAARHDTGSPSRLFPLLLRIAAFHPDDADEVPAENELDETFTERKQGESSTKKKDKKEKRTKEKILAVYRYWPQEYFSWNLDSNDRYREIASLIRANAVAHIFKLCKKSKYNVKMEHLLRNFITYHPSHGVRRKCMELYLMIVPYSPKDSHHRLIDFMLDIILEKNYPPSFKLIAEWVLSFMCVARNSMFREFICGRALKLKEYQPERVMLYRSLSRIYSYICRSSRDPFTVVACFDRIQANARHPDTSICLMSLAVHRIVRQWAANSGYTLRGALNEFNLLMLRQKENGSRIGEPKNWREEDDRRVRQASIDSRRHSKQSTILEGDEENEEEDVEWVEPPIPEVELEKFDGAYKKEIEYVNAYEANVRNYVNDVCSDVFLSKLNVVDNLNFGSVFHDMPLATGAKKNDVIPRFIWKQLLAKEDSFWFSDNANKFDGVTKCYWYQEAKDKTPIYGGSYGRINF